MKVLLFLMFVFVFANAYTQDKLTKDFIVKQSGDTIWGTVKKHGDKYFTRYSFKFKADGTNSWVKYNSDEVKSMRKQGLVRITKVVGNPSAFSKDAPDLVAILRDGKIKLYVTGKFKPSKKGSGKEQGSGYYATYPAAAGGGVYMTGPAGSSNIYYIELPDGDFFSFTGKSWDNKLAPLLRSCPAVVSSFKKLKMKDYIEAITIYNEKCR